jgi:hypothetical protein
MMFVDVNATELQQQSYSAALKACLMIHQNIPLMSSLLMLECR